MSSLHKHKRRIMKPFSVSYLLRPYVLVLLFHVWNNVIFCNAIEDQHHEVSYLHGGTVCFTCPPGTFRYRHCSRNFTSSDCRPCPPQTFQSHHTQARRCQNCLQECLHDTNMVAVKACSRTADLTCKCRDGYYLHNDGFTHTCKKHTPCDRDQYTLQNGTATSDFVCSMCPENQFYKGQGQCVSCTSCESMNKTQLTPCSSDEDATCHETQSTSVTEMTAHNPSESNNTPFIIAGILGVAIVVVVAALALIFHYKRREHTITLPLNVESPDPGKPDATSLPLLAQRQVSSSSSTYHPAEFPELADPTTWTMEVFLILSRRLTQNWKAFMRNLPGDATYNAEVHYKCEQVELDVQGIPERVYQMLQWWSVSQSGPDVSVDNILYTLHKIGGCEDVQKEIRRHCSKLTRRKAKNNSSANDNNDALAESGRLMTS
ncbi:tumor necrosis factor receptor superfamily member 25-like [Haliotis rubra]|uniref:tumor necrosis factor receptor superfamily member 25-like n=1 Tax=Haliotis rubra TaxID=36100 RepID=UPI001EE62C78|nr:tumor necrosis factor receptor superfamily member 25-like [Haliotis rubra]